MKSVGQVIKEARLRKKFSREKVEKETKIKREFVEAIEEENWGKLPEFPVVVGFVKSIARVLKLDRRKIVALLRRDYPPKSLRINPKPQEIREFTWSPKLTFLVGILLTFLIISAYLTIQYVGFISPPPLSVSVPTQGQEVKQTILLVEGKTDPEAVVRINNQPVLVDEEGSFKGEIEIFEGTNEVEIKAISRSGKETVIRRKIRPEISD